MSSPKAKNIFANVVLPLAIPLAYTYSIPPRLAESASVGCRVVVQLGKRKLYTGIIIKVHHEKPDYDVKDVIDVLDEKPIIIANQIRFWEWIRTYYMCHLGEVMNAAIPAGLKLESETRLLKNLDSAVDWNNLSDHEFLLMEALENRTTFDVNDAGKILELKNPLPVIKQLIERELLVLEEEVKGDLSPKTYNLIALSKAFSDAEINDLFSALNNSPKQSELLLAYFQLKSKFKDGQVAEKQLLKLAQANKQSLNSLIKKEVFKRTEQLFAPEEIQSKANLVLSKAQQKAQTQIKLAFQKSKPVLLHGVTSSGKTEIYISLIQEALKTKKRALYLVPEISLTTQLVNRLQHHFGDSALVYHSRISQRERLSVYTRLINNEKPLVLLGARSSLLLPLKDLGIIIIDEEHDSSFKQQDPAPRYQARDAALVLAQLNNCPILLGSATPSAESFHNALEKKYELVELKERFGGVHLPEMEVVDIRKETLWKKMHGHYSPQLFAEIEEALADEKKVILFQNRRGYSPVVQCTSCGHTHQCVNCDISLTYHKFSHKLKCHYCGYTVPPQAECAQCGSSDLKEIGFGTEKLEEELKSLIPTARIARMDFDSTRKKNAFGKLISKFEDGDIDILIGTQMVTKGLDFDDVKLVGILNADGMLHYPDFRAQERAFQLMEQVAGRAGRRNEQGRVTIQSFKPDHPIIGHVINHNYMNMITEQLAERKIFKYPPFTKLIHLDFRHRDLKTIDYAADFFARELRKQFSDMVLGPEYPPAKKRKNVYHKSILMKLNKETSTSKAKLFIWQLYNFMQQTAPFKSVKIVFDVDPY